MKQAKKLCPVCKEEMFEGTTSFDEENDLKVVMYGCFKRCSREVVTTPLGDFWYLTK